MFILRMIRNIVVASAVIALVMFVFLGLAWYLGHAIEFVRAYFGLETLVKGRNSIVSVGLMGMTFAMGLVLLALMGHLITKAEE